MRRFLLLRGADREHQRREAVERVLDVQVGTVVEQHLHDLEMAVVAGVEQGRGVVAELRVDVDPFVEQRLHRRGVPFARGVLELLGLGRRRRLRERQRRGGEQNQRVHGLPFDLFADRKQVAFATNIDRSVGDRR